MMSSIRSSTEVSGLDLNTKTGKQALAEHDNFLNSSSTDVKRELVGDNQAGGMEPEIGETVEGIRDVSSGGNGEVELIGVETNLMTVEVCRESENMSVVSGQEEKTGFCSSEMPGINFMDSGGNPRVVGDDVDTIAMNEVNNMLTDADNTVAVELAKSVDECVGGVSHVEEQIEAGTSSDELDRGNAETVEVLEQDVVLNVEVGTTPTVAFQSTGGEPTNINLFEGAFPDSLDPKLGDSGKQQESLSGLSTDEAPVNVSCEALEATSYDGHQNVRKQQLEVAKTNDQDEIAIEPSSSADDSVSVPDKTNKRTVARERASACENQDHVRYYFPRLAKEGFYPSDVVWGKVKSHPWWPGQIFDSSYASEMALKHQRREGFLVAYFGDKTFAWCEESQLKPFHKHFPILEKQSTAEPFLYAIDEVLGEVSRRIQLGLTCACLPEDAFADIKYQKVENAGIKEGFCGSVIDNPRAVDCFQPDCLLEYLQSLAQFPTGGADRLDLVIANAQLRAFYRRKGYHWLPTFVLGGLLGHSAEMTADGVNDSKRNAAAHSTQALSDPDFNNRNSEGRKRKSTENLSIFQDDGEENLSEMLEDEAGTADEKRDQYGAEAVSNGTPISSDKKRKIVCSAETGMTKEKAVNCFGDQEPRSPSVSSNGSFRVGELIRRAATQLTVSRPILKPSSEIIRRCTLEVGDFTDDDFSFDMLVDAPPNIVEKGLSEGSLSTDELLSQLCLAATDPLEGGSLVSSIVNFFTEFRKFSCSFSEGSKRGRKRNSIVKIESPPVSPGSSPCASPRRGRRGRKQRVEPCLDDSYLADSNLVSIPVSSDVTPDHMKDSYWSDIVLHDNPEKKLLSNGLNRKGESHVRRRRQKMKHDRDLAQSPSSVSGLETPTLMQVGPPNVNHERRERPVIVLEEKIVEERTPTALILNFSKPDSIPSETKLTKIFSRYGPLRESDTEVQRKLSRAKVVFKKRSDAERAFSSAGKFSVFGPTLLSYKLKNFPLTTEDFPNAGQQEQGETESAEHDNLDASVQKITSLAADEDPAQVVNEAQEALDPGQTQIESEITTGADSALVDTQVPPGAGLEMIAQGIVDQDKPDVESLVAGGIAPMECAELAACNLGLAQSDTGPLVYEEIVQVESKKPLGDHAEFKGSLADHDMEANEVANTALAQAGADTSVMEDIAQAESKESQADLEMEVEVLRHPGQPDGDALVVEEMAQTDIVVLAMSDSVVFVQQETQDNELAEPVESTDMERIEVAGLGAEAQKVDVAGSDILQELEKETTSFGHAVQAGDESIEKVDQVQEADVEAPLAVDQDESATPMASLVQDKGTAPLVTQSANSENNMLDPVDQGEALTESSMMVESVQLQEDNNAASSARSDTETEVVAEQEIAPSKAVDSVEGGELGASMPTVEIADTESQINELAEVEASH